MKVERNEAGVRALEAGLDRAHRAALEQMAEQARAEAPHRSGEYAASLETTLEGDHGALFSRLPQAGAVERGADVGPRRGPHMAGSHTIVRAGATFADRMTRQLRGEGG